MNDTDSNISIPKRVAAINDLTGFGRCSLAVVLPVLNAMKVQACPVPTSVFSSHMAFPSYYYRDLSDGLSPYLEEYRKLVLVFDGIYCGYINSPGQFIQLRRFMEVQLASGDPLILIDPVLGDNGHRYRLVTEETCRNMREFASFATILTPNLTEACLLTGQPCPEGTVETAFLQELMERLLDLGPSKAVITGIPANGSLINYCGERNSGRTSVFSCKTSSNGESRPGTGDLFAAVLTADAVNQVPFSRSVQKAAAFVRTCVLASAHAHVPVREGVLFENYLSLLWE